MNEEKKKMIEEMREKHQADHQDDWIFQPRQKVKRLSAEQVEANRKKREAEERKKIKPKTDRPKISHAEVIARRDNEPKENQPIIIKAKKSLDEFTDREESLLVKSYQSLARSIENLKSQGIIA
jgi:lantibiotic modifying enzyme